MSARRPGRPGAAEPERARGRPQRGTSAPPAPQTLLAGWATPGRPAAARARAPEGVARPAQPDWIANRLAVSGPAAEVAAFRAAAEGAGVVPWRVDDHAAEERWLGLMLAAAGAPRAGGPGLAAEARHIAGELRAAWLDEVSAAAARVGRARDCPLDLHALVPVPAAVLALGPDDPSARRWLWENWGTTWPLRRVRLLDGRTREEAATLAYGFVSADWSPWQALRRLRALWPGLSLELRPSHG